MNPAGLQAFKESVEKPHLVYNNRKDGIPVIPDDLKSELKKNTTAFDNFSNFTQSSQRMYIDWLNSTKKPETRIRRISKIICLSEKNIKPGMNVI
jgi:uncharacterized protein YdeI (YjbR/CyaY-like superfamily)